MKPPRTFGSPLSDAISFVGTALASDLARVEIELVATRGGSAMPDATRGLRSSAEPGVRRLRGAV